MSKSALPFILLALIAMSATAHAEVRATAEIKHIPCQKEVFHTLEGWETPTRWRRQAADSRENFQVISSPTTQAGVRLKLIVTRSSSKLMRITQDTVLEVAFEKSSCTPILRSRHKTSVVNTNNFTDQDLIQVLDKSRDHQTDGMIYVWSPHMNLSVTGAHEAVKLAQQKHLNLVLLIDPNSNLEFARKVARKHGISARGLKKLDSQDLIGRGVSVHYPALILFSKGQLLDKFRPGYDSPAHLEAYLTENLHK